MARSPNSRPWSPVILQVSRHVYVKLKDRKRSLRGKNNYNALWHYRNSHNSKFRVVAVLNNRNALWHVKICHDAKFVLWLLKEMTITSSDFMKIIQTTKEVANQLMDIFCMLGDPFILQSDNGREYVNKIIQNLADMWPGMKLVHGKPRHSQSQGSVERFNQDVRDMLVAWMSDNAKTWSEGLRFTQSKEGFGLKVTCNLCVRDNGIIIERDGAKSGQEKTSSKNGFSLQLDFQQFILGQTLWSGCLTLIEDV